MPQSIQINFDRALTELATINSTLLSENFVNTASEKVGMPKDQLIYYLKLSIEEAEHALEILSEYNLSGKRLLEVGCGPGIMATALRKAGIEITTLEPGGKGIEYNKLLAVQVFDCLNVRGEHLDISADDLDPTQHGTFDFIFSHNVLEHVDNLQDCFDAMISVLASGGSIVGHCPNYFIPYEPHYGSWLIPLFPRCSRPFLSRKHLKDDGTWWSLNFISARDVRRTANRHKCKLKFKSGVMATAFERIANVPTFKERHGGLQKIYHIMKIFRLLPLLKKWPGQFGSPMTFEMHQSALHNIAGDNS